MKTVEFGRYMDLKNDFAFKTIFQNRELLISFLNGIFKGRKTIVKVDYQDPDRLGRKREDRKACFDLYCIDDTGERLIVEMQVIEQEHFMDRCVFYSTFPIRDQAKKGKWDFKLKPLYVISIVNFFLWKDNEQCINYHSLMNEETLTKSSDKLQFITVELKKFNKTVDELETDFDSWLYCLKHLPELPEQPTNIKGEVFDELFELAEYEKLTEEDMEKYRKSVLEYNDVQNAVAYAGKKALAEGMQKGMQKGMQQGMQQGIQQGVYEIAQKCVQEGMSLDLVIRLTGLTPEQLAEIQS
jgi:predicted transposase/invertase (TIGR01784 family)